MAGVDYSQFAGFYDALVTDTSDLQFFLSCSRRAGGRVAELMAGTGRLAVPLLVAGVDLTCIDSSPEMLDVLRAKLRVKGLQARIICADVTRLSVPFLFNLIFIAFHSFEELVTDEDREACLRAVHRHLAPGGSFVCTLHDVALRVVNVGSSGDVTHRFMEPRSGREVALSLDTRYDPGTGLVAGTESFTWAGETSPFLRMPIRFRLTEAATFHHLASGAGFEIEAVVDGYSGTEYRSGESRTASGCCAKELTV